MITRKPVTINICADPFTVEFKAVDYYIGNNGRMDLPRGHVSIACNKDFYCSPNVRESLRGILDAYINTPQTADSLRRISSELNSKAYALREQISLTDRTLGCFMHGDSRYF